MGNITLEIREDTSTPKFRLLAESVKNAISEGRLKTGDTLPSVSYVCGRFGMSRDTVFKAYTLLREQGVVMSQPGKGYYVADHVTRVFVFLDTFKAYKEVLYDSFFHNLPKNVIADVSFHHYDSKLFKKLIDDNLGRYSKYIVMPFLSDEVEKSLSKIPKDRLLVIDWNLYTGERSNTVYQDFGKALYRGLMEVKEQIMRYDSFHMLYPNYTYHPYQAVMNYDRFCRDAGVKGLVENDPDALDVVKGRAYLSVSDRMLGHVLEQCKVKGYVVGEDVGIISYNETPMKKFIEKGITVFSTDFAQMGQLAAQFVTKGEYMNVCVPSKMLIRKSL